MSYKQTFFGVRAFAAPVDKPGILGLNIVAPNAGSPSFAPAPLAGTDLLSCFGAAYVAPKNQSIFAFLTALIMSTALFTAGIAKADVSFSDQTFSAANYTTVFNYQELGATSTPIFVGGSLMFQINEDGVTTPLGARAVLTGVVNNSFVYDPATEGSISSIAASSDKTFSVTRIGDGMITYGNNFRPLIEQSGMFYAAAIPGANLVIPGGQLGSTVGPSTLSQSGLTESSFIAIDPMTGLFTSGNPNFSGAPLTFGIVQLLDSVGQPLSATTTYDNLSIQITSTPAGAPAPLAGAGLLSFFGAGGVAIRKRARRVIGSLLSRRIVAA